MWEKIKSDKVNLILSVVGAMLAIIFVGLTLSLGPSLFENQTSKVGFFKNPPVALRDFTLTSQDGQPIKLSDLKGKGVLMFFGYTHCPDVCPVTLAEFLRVKKALGADADKIAFVLISLDGSRDTPEVLKNYLKSFDPTFICLTGDEDTVRGIITDFAGQFQRQKDTGSAESYLVAHTSFSYFINPEGRWAAAYPFQADPNEIAKDLQLFLK